MTLSDEAIPWLYSYKTKSAKNLLSIQIHVIAQRLHNIITNAHLIVLMDGNLCDVKKFILLDTKDISVVNAW